MVSCHESRHCRSCSCAYFGVILPSQSNADPTENGSIEIPNLIMTFIEEVNILEIIYFLFFNWSLVSGVNDLI
jgi:hypothetical protein